MQASSTMVQAEPPPSTLVVNHPPAGSPENVEGLQVQVLEAYQAFQDGNWTEATTSLLVKVALPGVLALVALIILYLFAKLFARWAAAFLSHRFDRTIGYFGGQLAFYSIMLFSGLAILQTLGVGITAFAAVLGAMGLAIGLALQGTLSNFASGVLLLVFRPFKAGHMVQTAGVLGKVHAIELFTTTFDTPDNRRLIVPNSSIVGATIENISFHAERRVEVIVGVDYSARLDVTRSILESCQEAVDDLLISGENRGFTVILGNLGPSSVDWKVRAWTATSDYFAMQEALTEAIKQRLDEHGITIPFPQMQLHLSRAAAANQPLTEAVADATPSESAEIKSGSSAVSTTSEELFFFQDAESSAESQSLNSHHGASSMRRKVKPRSRTSS